jgi:lipopolysaccharide transport system ATP-binding protein
MVNMYNSLIARKENVSIMQQGGRTLEHGNFKVKIIGTEIRNEHGESNGTFVSGERVAVEVFVKASCTVNDVVIGVLIRDRFGQDIFGVNSKQFHENVSLAAGQEARFEFEILLSLGVGGYTLTVAAHTGDTHLEDNFHWCDAVKTFDVVSGEMKFTGLAKLDTSLEITYAQ